MKFKRSAPAILISSVVIVITLISLVCNKISSQMIDASEQKQFAMMAAIVQSKIKDAENKAIGNAEMIGAMSSVKAAFANRDKDKLISLTQDIYRIQHEKYGFTLTQFHTPPAMTFLRLHRIEDFGDDVSSWRQLVVDVNRNVAIRKGIEITKSGVAIFGTLPMTDVAGAHTGSFEMALEFDSLLDNLKTAYGFELAVFIDEKKLREVATSLTGDVLNEQNRVGKYLKFYSTHSELFRTLVTDTDINIFEDAHYVRNAVGIPYGVLLQPLYNYANKQIGVIAVSNNFSATRSDQAQAIIWQTLLALTAIILLIGIILIVVRGLLLQPLAMLNESLAALVQDDIPQPLPETQQFCEEIQQLAENYQRLRAKITHRE
jgi:hypothetical protein